MTIRQARAEGQRGAAYDAERPRRRLGSDREPPRSAPHRRRWPAGLALLLGGLILGLAVPRVLASAWLALRDPVLEQMDGGEPVSDAELLGLIASRELALGWVEDRETHDQRGTALAELAFRGDLQGAAGTVSSAGSIGPCRVGNRAAFQASIPPSTFATSS